MICVATFILQDPNGLVITKLLLRTLLYTIEVVDNVCAEFCEKNATKQ